MWRAGGTEWADYYGDTNYSAGGLRGQAGGPSRSFVAERPAPDRLGPGRERRDVQPHRRRGRCPDGRVRLRSRLRREELPPGPRRQGAFPPAPAPGPAPTPARPPAGSNAERMALAERGPADAVLALALVHHLAIGNNVPLEMIAGALARLGRRLLVEFVPKSDSQVARLLVTREDIFDGYTQEGFERAFAARFETVRRVPLVRIGTGPLRHGAEGMTGR
ncbi:MAG: hypothetical protein MZU91_00830 [Desulfosudis oleivorans]|nr:hypothetical protein [Desulfosudis oleivorans]